MSPAKEFGFLVPGVPQHQEAQKWDRWKESMGIGVRPPPLTAWSRVSVERTVSEAGIFSLGADVKSSGGEETKGGDASIAVSDLRLCSAQTARGHRNSMGCCMSSFTQGLGVLYPAAGNQTFTKLTQFFSILRGAAECIGAGPAPHHSAGWDIKLICPKRNFAMLLELV